MNWQRFTRSLRICLSSVSLFLFGHFFGFSPGAARTQYFAPDALLLSAFAQSLYHWYTHAQHTLALAAASPTSSAFALSLANAQHTLVLAASPTSSAFALSLAHAQHTMSLAAASPTSSAFAISLSHAQHTLALAAASPTTFCLRSISGPRTTHTVARRQPRYALPSIPHCIAGQPTLSLSLGTTAVQRICKSTALRVPALRGFANLLQYLSVTQKSIIHFSFNC